ncbi:mannosyltransferase, partial [Thoreauomyces humboldtii]
MQTWEYSPVYAIRSWTYAWAHSVIGRFMELLVAKNKMTVFYETRGALAIASSYTEAKLYEAVLNGVSPVAARYLLVILLFSTGMFIASAAYLPSSFAMYTVTLAIAHSFEMPGRSRTYRVVMLVGAGALLGWPFSAAAGIPFVLEELTLSGTAIKRLQHLIEAGILTLLAVLLPMVLMDSLLYGRFTVVPLNIVLYNVFGSKDTGPDIYGTEPWWFYLLNGALNFNLVFPLALVSMPSVLINASLNRWAPSVPSSYDPEIWRLTTKLMPVYVWLGIFSLQPHKEERFIFVIYPLLCLNAAVTLSVVRNWVARIALRFTVPTMASRAATYLTSMVLVIYCLLSLSRTLALYNHYHAPLDVYAQVASLPGLPISIVPGIISNNSTIEERNLCVGKEWYRFPGHYFLPDGVNLRFLRSGFRGLLPKYFDDASATIEKEGHTTMNRKGRFGVRNTGGVPAGMNNRNHEALDRYVDLELCDYLVDYTPPPSPSSSRAEYDPEALEPAYALDEAT